MPLALHADARLFSTLRIRVQETKKRVFPWQYLNFTLDLNIALKSSPHLGAHSRLKSHWGFGAHLWCISHQKWGSWGGGGTIPASTISFGSWPESSLPSEAVTGDRYWWHICNANAVRNNPGCTDHNSHDILLKENVVKWRSYRIPEHFSSLLKELMISLGITEISQSEWCNPGTKKTWHHDVLYRLLLSELCF